MTADERLALVRWVLLVGGVLLLALCFAVAIGHWRLAVAP